MDALWKAISSDPWSAISAATAVIATTVAVRATRRANKRPGIGIDARREIGPLQSEQIYVSIDNPTDRVVVVRSLRVVSPSTGELHLFSDEEPARMINPRLDVDPGTTETLALDLYRSRGAPVRLEARYSIWDGKKYRDRSEQIVVRDRN